AAEGRLTPAYLALWRMFRERVLADPQHNPTELWRPADLQVEWLRAAGFADAAVWWQHEMWAVFGGTKGRTDAERVQTR
ncbi:MAG: hypothetical protein QHJ73_18165, partial [Armatimonadota bacterium]|nr:hypothetical protein [Armatimonadota bacterium]